MQNSTMAWARPKLLSIMFFLLGLAFVAQAQEPTVTLPLETAAWGASATSIGVTGVWAYVVSKVAKLLERVLTIVERAQQDLCGSKTGIVIEVKPRPVDEA